PVHGGRGGRSGHGRARRVDAVRCLRRTDRGLGDGNRASRPIVAGSGGRDQRRSAGCGPPRRRRGWPLDSAWAGPVRSPEALDPEIVRRLPASSLKRLAIFRSSLLVLFPTLLRYVGRKTTGRVCTRPVSLPPITLTS